MTASIGATEWTTSLWPKDGAPHPHYELIAQMTVHDGDGEVREYYQDTRVALPTRTTRSSRCGTATTR